MSVRTAVVLAAGEGTRLRPLTRNRPKPMLPAADRPILEHVLDALVEAGMDRLVLVVGYRRERVQEHFGPTYRGVDIEYVVQHKQLGSGHALLQARDAVSGSVVVVNGDRLVAADSVATVRDAFDADTARAALAVIERADASRYGAVTLRDRDIAEIVEKPDTGDYRMINAGIYAFAESVFEAIETTPRESGELALPDTIARLVENERVRGVRIGGLWVDATYPWDLLEVSAEVLARGRIDGSPRRDGIWVDRSAQVHDDATLRAPVVVGPDCEVAPGAVLGPVVALGQNVTVGPTVAAERSVVDADTRVGAGSTLEDAVLAHDVHLGANTTVPGGPADVRVGHRVFEEQRLGAVVADRARARGGVTLEPGTLVGPAATLGPGTTVSGEIRENAEVVR
ncbi:MAG: bifunctional sugar-1-phosphate nucleotidylyltransferase/acetyltransferase [Salinirussus sp.]